MPGPEGRGAQEGPPGPGTRLQGKVYFSSRDQLGKPYQNDTKERRVEEGPLGETQSLRASLRLVTRGEARGLHPELPAQKKSDFLGYDSNYCWAETAPRWVDFQLPDAAGALTLTHTSTRPFLLPPLHAPPPPSG